MGKIKYYLVMNPTSNSGRAKKVCEKILSAFESRQLEFDYKMTREPEEAVFISAEAIKKGWDVIVAVGGDGTICEVISGFFLNGSVDSKVKLGVLHIGTSPDFNRYHNIPTKLEEAIDTLIKGKAKLIDIGKATYMKMPSKKATAYFGSNVNVGLGPLIANKANSRYRKYLGDFLGTLCSTLTSLINFKGVRLNIEIDGSKCRTNRLVNLTVGKDPYLASGMRIFNDIAPNDGKLYIFSVEKLPLISYIANIHKLYIGNFLEFKGSRIDYGRRVDIESDENVSIEFDGDMRGYLPATVEVIPKALEVITR
ncbi:MAG: YegS/Rv2252/BmrU family lipid kinase [Candidatus Omnitrophica bacterium]|nr:YegS/Rv2252/BmrU family lipid kinase [Candidatus Omnitrophota bacterium]